jgi:hypothetical protein
MTTIICWCKTLVDVVDRKIAVHNTPEGEPCSRGSQAYIPQRIHVGHPRGQGKPSASFEVMGAKPVEIDCRGCGGTHDMIELTGKVHHHGAPEFN